MTKQVIAETNHTVNTHIMQCCENMTRVLPAGYHGQVVVNIEDSKVTTFKKSETVKKRR